ncbi:hypothetical protein KFL_000090650 [Klebsormidium nitens]|uniref:Uncharacterized protein n=1 Tax=Klebsormidium nitens TaxID=105231 RepID=A0A1Y1HM09_KLENI|nr:hypothetical protein KFL_000090650 [Klebsormidium nitens]|eukprot:GAQ78219.1 hypothetical protein KFL_000090650 [Klebsormidium nitens]
MALKAQVAVTGLLMVLVLANQASASWISEALFASNGSHEIAHASNQRSLLQAPQTFVCPTFFGLCPFFGLGQFGNTIPLCCPSFIACPGTLIAILLNCEAALPVTPVPTPPVTITTKPVTTPPVTAPPVTTPPVTTPPVTTPPVTTPPVPETPSPTPSGCPPCPCLSPTPTPFTPLPSKA